MQTIRRLWMALLLMLAAPVLATAQVDINHADARTLAESLDGVGLVKAEAIVAYRNANGPFKRAEDLAKVKGIGAKTIDANRDSIVIVQAQDDGKAQPAARPYANH